MDVYKGSLVLTFSSILFLSTQSFFSTGLETLDSLGAVSLLESSSPDLRGWVTSMAQDGHRESGASVETRGHKCSAKVSGHYQCTFKVGREQRKHL